MRSSSPLDRCGSEPEAPPTAGAALEKAEGVAVTPENAEGAAAVPENAAGVGTVAPATAGVGAAGLAPVTAVTPPPNVLLNGSLGLTAGAAGGIGLTGDAAGEATGAAAPAGDGAGPAGPAGGGPAGPVGVGGAAVPAVGAPKGFRNGAPGEAAADGLAPGAAGEPTGVAPGAATGAPGVPPVAGADAAAGAPGTAANGLLGAPGVGARAAGVAAGVPVPGVAGKGLAAWPKAQPPNSQLIATIRSAVQKAGRAVRRLAVKRGFDFKVGSPPAVLQRPKCTPFARKGARPFPSGVGEGAHPAT